MSNLIKFAKTEMDIFNGEHPDEMQIMITKNILELIKVFSEQGHSGSSAPYLLNIFSKLARWEPITIISFEDKWWHEVSNNIYQHARNSATFKEGKDGKPYYIDAYIKCWEHEPSSRWSGSLLLENNKMVKKCYIKDPANMPTVKILIPLKFNKGGGDWEFKEVNESKLKELKKYYDLEIVQLVEKENEIV